MGESIRLAPIGGAVLIEIEGEQQWRTSDESEPVASCTPSRWPACSAPAPSGSHRSRTPSASPPTSARRSSPSPRVRREAAQTRDQPYQSDPFAGRDFEVADEHLRAVALYSTSRRPIKPARIGRVGTAGASCRSLVLLRLRVIVPTFQSASETASSATSFWYIPQLSMSASAVLFVLWRPRAKA